LVLRANTPHFEEAIRLKCGRNFDLREKPVSNTCFEVRPFR
jgi:hypothetical protein